VSVPNATFLIDRQLPDGRFVIVNCTRCDVPVGAVLRQLYSTLSEYSDERWNPQPYGEATDVELKVESVEVFQRSIDVIPNGYSAAARFSGTDVEAVAQRLSSAPERVQVFLSEA